MARPADPLLGLQRTDSLLALQRAAGNQAVSTLVQRAPVIDTTGHTTVIRFTVGTEITANFAQTAKGLVADGRFDARDLETLRSAALSLSSPPGPGEDSSVSDDERMFMAALLDPHNLARLRRQPLASAGDVIEFPVASITAAGRARVADLDRPKLPADVVSEEHARDKAMKGGDRAGAILHAFALEQAAMADVLRLAGSFAPAAQATMALGQPNGVSAAMIVRAMIAAASDSTEGDLALAGAVYVIAHVSGSSLEADVLAGHIKVDEVPKSALDPGEWAAYQAAGSGKKGDTIYLPTDFDPSNLAHRGAVVHELVHAEDDKAAAGPKVQSADRDQNELRAYRNQGRFLLNAVEPLTGADRTAAVQQAASVWNALIVYTMALEARADRRKFAPVLRAINAAAPAANQTASRDITAALTWPEPRVEAFLLGSSLHPGLIPRAYGIPAATRVTQEGLGGESILDWVNRPL